MGEKEEASGLCSECNSNSWKYKCPSCFIRTCSLPCVKSHKAKTGCTGKRSLTDVVPLSKFDDNILLADYNMLEDVKRVAESAKRMRQEVCGYTHFRLPVRLKNLQRAANSRRTKILFLSNGMSKREKNKTYYNNRKKFISWTIEWRFHLADTVLIDHGVHENTSLRSVIENHLKPSPWNHPLRQFCEEPLDSLRFFIQKGTKSSFYELDIKVPLREQLTNKVILEYPVIYVFLPSHSCDFEVIRDSVPLKPEQNEPVCDSPSPKGMMFRVEDIEDGGSLDPHVSDLSSSKKEEITKLDQDICDDLDLVYSYMKENDRWLKEDCAYLSDVLTVDEEPEEGEIEFKSSTEEKESNKSVLTTSQGARSFVSGPFNVDDEDICDDTYLFHSSMKEKVLGEKEECTYLSEVLHVDEELEEGEIA